MARAHHKNTSCFLVVIALLGGVGCASRPPETTVRIDPNQERLVALTDQLDVQKQRIAELTSALEKLKGEIPPKEGKSVPLENLPSVPAHSMTKAMEGDGETEDEAVESQGTSVVDSSQEVMHWYQEGLRLHEQKQFENSSRNFQTFIKNAPDHVYSDRALYWIAQNYFLNQEYDLAIVKTNSLESKYPWSFRTADSMFTRALSHLNLGQREMAVEILKDLMTRFPGHPTSDQASKKVAELSVARKTREQIPLLPE